MKRSVVTFVAGAALLVSACDEAARVPSAVAVRDSAGVRIVESSGPAWGADEGWGIVFDPVVEIGAIEGAQPYLFSRVESATRLPDGRFVIVEGDTYEIRFFDPGGTYITTIGAQGQGPGEFQGAPDVMVLPGDTVMAYDSRAFRKSWFTMDGQLVRDAGLSIEGMIVNLVGASSRENVHFPDGSFFLVAGFPPSYANPLEQEGTPGYTSYGVRISPPGVVGSVDARLAIVPADGSPGVVLDEAPGIEEALAVGGSGPFRFLNPYRAAAYWAVDSRAERVHLSTPGHREIRTFDGDGVLRRIVRQALPQEPLTEGAIADRMAMVRDSASSVGVPGSGAAELFDRMTFPDSIPAFSGIEVDADGTVWALRFRLPEDSADREYDLFDIDGVWLGAVAVPLGLGEILEIGSGYLLTLYMDELEVPFVRMYGIEKP